MNIKLIVVLAVVPTLFGCASTTVKTYSADFKVYPVETKGVGDKHTTPDGGIYIVPQMYRYECILKETVHSEGKEPVTKTVSSPFVTTGSDSARVGVVEKDTINGSMFEVEKEETDSGLQILLKSTFKRADSESVTCSQTITITKTELNQWFDPTLNNSNSLVPQGTKLKDAKRIMLDQGFDWNFKEQVLNIPLGEQESTMSSATCTRSCECTRWVAIILFNADSTVSDINVSKMRLTN